MTQQKPRRVATLPAEYNIARSYCVVGLCYSLATKRRRKKILVDDGRSKTLVAPPAPLCGKGLSGSDLRRRADHRGATLQAEMEKPRRPFCCYYSELWLRPPLGVSFHQVALTTTDNDNGFVTMFFLLIPALSALITVPLSWWIPDLRFAVGPMFYTGLALVTVSLLFFLLKSWRRLRRPSFQTAAFHPPRPVTAVLPPDYARAFPARGYGRAYKLNLI